ncbi:MAG: hypothetical protein JXA78_06590 [Anaerolineales bacterium]|nr:hypothetical protein [Anaerolineales bacterium]
MSPETMAFLVFLLGFGMLCCFFGLIVVLMIGGGTFIFSRIFKINKQAGEALVDDTQTYLAKVEADLRPWEAGALGDFSSLIEYAGRAALGNLQYRGTVQSFSEPESAWLVFDLQLKRMHGAMLLRTTRHRLQLDFGGFGNKPVGVRVDGAPFGSIRDNAVVALFDVQARQVGVYHQHRFALNAQPTDYNVKSYYGPVELEGRPLGELNRNPLLTRKLLGETPASLLIQQVPPGLAREDEIWLLALVGWEISNRILVRA